MRPRTTRSTRLIEPHPTFCHPNFVEGQTRGPKWGQDRLFVKFAQNPRVTYRLLRLNALIPSLCI